MVSDFLEVEYAHLEQRAPARLALERLGVVQHFDGVLTDNLALSEHLYWKCKNCALLPYSSLSRILESGHRATRFLVLEVVNKGIEEATRPCEAVVFLWQGHSLE